MIIITINREKDRRKKKLREEKLTYSPYLNRKKYNNNNYGKREEKETCPHKGRGMGDSNL
jgi:hypothetical protein